MFEEATPHALQELGVTIGPFSAFERANGCKAARWFGLSRSGDQWWLGFFVGVQRLPGAERPISVTPRFPGMDYAAMYAACAADPVVSDHLEHTFYVRPEEPDVPLNTAEHPWFSELLVLAYLRALSQLCGRHLRRGFTRQAENLTGRVKGRIRVSDQFRLNLSRQRPDRTMCEFGVFERDTRENRILRAALEVGVASLARSRHYGGEAARWAGASRAALSGVSIVSIGLTDFALARTRGTYARYAGPLRLARAVLQHLGLDPHGIDRPHDGTHAPPFALCTYELFERFAEVRLREEGYQVWAGYGDKNLGDGAFRARPDFILSRGDNMRERIIADAKYKQFEGFNADLMRADVYKSIAYAKHRGVLECLGGPATEVVLAYPRLTMDAWERVDHSFGVDLRIRAISCPLLEGRA